MTMRDIAGAYTDEQRAVIERTLARCQTDDWISYERSSGLHIKGCQFFANFGGLAYEVFLKRTDIDGDTLEMVPAVAADGNCVLKRPEEGPTGVLHLTRFVMTKGRPVEDAKWLAQFVHSGWLYVDELDMAPAEIAKRIMSEIADCIEAEIDADRAHLIGFGTY